MRFYVAITDFDWFSYLSVQKPDEVNFWQPSAHGFKNLQPGEPLLFKLHSPRNYIVGGGFFSHYAAVPLTFAWDAFGTKNGAQSLDEMRRRVWKYRAGERTEGEQEVVGCIMLQQPFFFAEPEWIPVSDWPMQTVQGKCTLRGDTHYFAVFPHMHQIGTHIAVTATVGGATQTLYDADYTFNNQDFKEWAPIAMQSGDTTPELAREIGDLLFAVVNLSRKLRVDPERELRATMHRFRERFLHIERRLAEQGRTPLQSDLVEMDALWEVVNGDYSDGRNPYEPGPKPDGYDRAKAAGFFYELADGAGRLTVKGQVVVQFLGIDGRFGPGGPGGVAAPGRPQTRTCSH